MVDNTEILNKIAQYLVAQIKADLIAKDHKVTGKLEKSIFYRINDNSEIEIGSTYTNEYGLLGLSEGRRPSNKMPSRKMVDHVMESLKKKGLGYKNISRVRKGSSGAGRFKKRKAQSTIRSIAFGYARKMLMTGYTGSNIIEESYRKLESRIDSDIVENYRKILEAEIEKTIKEK